MEDNKKEIELNSNLVALEKYTGVDFGDKDIDQGTLKLIQANFADPIIMAKYICEENSDIVRCGDQGMLYKYNGKYYDFLSEKDLDAIVMNFCLKYNVTKAFKIASNILRALNVFPLVTSIKAMNPNENLINLNNGVLDIYTKKFTKHSPKYYFDYALEVSYNPEDTDCPVFMNFLDDVMSHEQDSIDNIIKLGGYLLDSSRKAKKCFFFDGDGGSGKSTLMDTFIMFFPEREIHPVVSSLSLDVLSGGGFDRSDLIYSRLNTCAETRKTMVNSEFLKLMVTGDPIQVSRKYDEPYTFRYKGVVVLLGNGLPRFNDTSDGIYRRIVIVKFKNQYKPLHEVEKIKFAKERRIFPQDPDLPEKIKAESSAILNLFIQGLIDLREKNYQFIESVSSQEAMVEFRRESDTVREFLESNYELSFEDETPLTAIFMEFRLWYMDNVQDTKSMKFRSAEMAKRIKEVFKIDSSGRKKFMNPDTKKYDLLTVYNLKKKSNYSIVDGELVEDNKDFDISKATDADMKQLGFSV